MMSAVTKYQFQERFQKHHITTLFDNEFEMII